MKVWTYGGVVNVYRDRAAGAGILDAGLLFGGDYSGPTGSTEEYNGVAWSTGGTLSRARRELGGCGTQDAGLTMGGYDANYRNYVDTYNGTSWTVKTSLGTSRNWLAACGTQDAGLAIGGGDAGGGMNTTEEYNGSTWAYGGNLSSDRYQLGGCGAQNAGLCFGGRNGGDRDITEEYNGTSWSAGGSLNATVRQLTGCGTQDAGLSFGGYNARTQTEEYDGAAWTVGSAMLAGRHDLAGAGTQNAGLATTGNTGVGKSDVTQEYASPIGTLQVGGAGYDILFDDFGPAAGATYSFWQTEVEGSGETQRVELEGPNGDYASIGTYTSGVIDFGLGYIFYRWDHTITAPAGTSATFEVRASNSPPMTNAAGGAWDWGDVPLAGDVEWNVANLPWQSIWDLEYATPEQQQRYTQFKATLQQVP